MSEDNIYCGKKENVDQGKDQACFAILNLSCQVRPH